MQDFRRPKTQTLWVYIGIMLAMLIYNVILTFRLRDKEYIIYILWVPCMATLVMADSGIGFRFLWPTQGVWNNYAPSVLSAFSSMLGGFFCITTMRVFRHVPTPGPQILLAGSILSGVFGLVCLFRLVPSLWAIQTALSITSIVISGIVTASIVCVVQGVMLSRAYLAAWSMMCVGGSIAIMQSFGVVSNSITENALQFGSTLEVLFMSVLLSARVHQERLKSEGLQQQTIQMQKHLNEALEKKVAERTQELDALNQELSLLSVTDGLTGLSNRRHFDELFSTMFHVAQRTKTPLYLFVIDLDFFKKINDSYGHAFGDTCLKHAAHIIQKHCKRNSDVVARFGGEEFVVLLSNTKATDAERLANNIRETLMNAPLTHRDEVVTLTCSIGVACNHLEDVKEQQLLERADEMLYRAKGAGRNCVKTHSLFHIHINNGTDNNIAV